jgi:hypothetical protein
MLMLNLKFYICKIIKFIVCFAITATLCLSIIYIHFRVFCMQIYFLIIYFFVIYFFVIYFFIIFILIFQFPKQFDTYQSSVFSYVSAENTNSHILTIILFADSNANINVPIW